MEGYIQTLLGVSVSLILSVIGYRQTIGATKERQRNANKEIETILFKRFVLENYHLKISDITRVTEGTAINNQVKSKNLLSETQILIALFTKIMENDFISPQNRSDLIIKIDKLIEKYEEELVNNQTDSEEKQNNINLSLLLQIGIAMTASTFGVLVSIFPDLNDLDKLLNEIISLKPAIIIIFGISLVLITGIFTIFKLKEEPTERHINPVLNGLRFEEEVLNIVKKFIPKQNINRDRTNYDTDLVIDYGNKKIVIEIKYWNIKPRIQMLKRMTERLITIKKKINADELIIVSNKPIDNIILEDIDIKAYTLKEFIKYLKHLK